MSHLLPIDEHQKACELMRQETGAMLQAVLGAALLSGCPCRECNQIKAYGIAAAMIEHLVNMHSMAAGSVDEDATKILHEQIDREAGALRAKYAAARMCGKANSPTTTTPQ